jgi:hypothetical protein
MDFPPMNRVSVGPYIERAIHSLGACVVRLESINNMRRDSLRNMGGNYRSASTGWPPQLSIVVQRYAPILLLAIVGGGHV